MGIRLLCVLAFLGLSVSSCAYHAKYRQSFPFGDKIKGKRHFERIILPDIDVHIKVYNSITLWEYTTLFTPITPVHINTKDQKSEKPFIVELGFLPKKPNFSFNPKNVYLKMGDEEIFEPIQYHELPLGNFESKAGWIRCGDWPDDRKFGTIVDKILALSSSRCWNCYIIVFDIEPPDPSQQFTIEIKGLEKQGEHYFVPVFQFKESQYKETIT